MMPEELYAWDNQCRQELDSVVITEYQKNAAADKKCLWPGCDAYRYGNGMCTRHRQKVYRAAKRIGVTTDEFVGLAIKYMCEVKRLEEDGCWNPSVGRVVR